jgi:erythromycin esterase-like protein
MADEGEWNVGQLARERYGDDAVLVGFTTYGGTVTAASDWDEPPRVKRVRPALDGSVEALLHDALAGDGLIPIRGRPETAEALAGRRLERAIGVIYRPETERSSHYFEADVAAQFDGVIHLDHTAAVEPLDPFATWSRAETPETYPTGI